MVRRRAPLVFLLLAAVLAGQADARKHGRHRHQQRQQQQSQQQRRQFEGPRTPHGFTQVKEGWRSPAGLIYRRDAEVPWRDGVSSVYMHTKDAPGRDIHGVFQSHPIKIIDEAWRRAQNGSRGVLRFDNQSGHVIEVEMGHTVGWLGGVFGARQGFPKATRVRLVLDDQGRLMSAYPHAPRDPKIPRPPRPEYREPDEPKVWKPKAIWETVKREVSPIVRAFLEKRGLTPERANLAAPHSLLGLPSPGVGEDDHLLVRERYVLSYNRGRRVMNWASWGLTREDFGSAEKQKDFRHDPDIPDDWGRIEESEYSGTPWTRGHMVPSGETTASPHLNSLTYLMTNIVPQATNVNSGPWNKMENWYRDQVRFEGKDAHLIAGTVFNGPQRVIGNGVHVPSATWKIVVLLERGQTLKDVNRNTRVIAAVMPNSNSIDHTTPWAGFRTSVADIERQTGLRFFDHLPHEVAEVLRNRVDREPIIDQDHPMWHRLQKYRAAR